MDLNISIGILAHNESVSISTTLQSLFQQSLFKESDPPKSIEIIVVPNGCTDNTAEVSRTALTELVKQCAQPNVRDQVCEVDQPGKSNAWNLYVHKFSDPAADYLFLMDADIQFLDPNTLRNMIDCLEAAPDLWISVDKPVKDVSLKEKKNLIERLSVQVSKESLGDDNAPPICGQLYCSRAAKLRQIWMPPGLPVEDGFLLAMVTTDLFRSKEDCEWVKRAPSASHIFEAYINIPSLLRHEKRLLVGSTLNAYLFGYLWANCNEQQDAGSLIKHNNEQNPRWLHELIQQAIQENGWWLIPQAFVFRRFEKLKYYHPLKAVLRFPFALLGFLVDLLLCFQANQQIHKGKALGYWGASQRGSLIRRFSEQTGTV
ncbi:MAG: glycosyltransferase family 2 protein [Coleofasciculus sp. Co-bin14]|nr:glycosyltransferase family 2 protein [Coleofasciculus sp. Co-bin14]